jgi:Ca-activated chloride channel family protein
MAEDSVMIQVAYPWVLAALILPFILRFILPKTQNEENGSALKVPFFVQLSLSFAKVSSPGSNLSYLKYLAAIIWILLVISGCGIQWLGKPLSIPQAGRDLIMAIDLSGSMQTPDMMSNGQALTRIDVVKKAANEFINNRSGDRIGLILFGTRAYLQTPLTFDRQTVASMLNDATIGIAGPETAIGDAIGLAIKQIMDYPGDSKAIVLLTDGSSNSGIMAPLEATELAKKEHIKIYTIGLGGGEMIIQTAFGPRRINTSGDLDIDALKQIANITGGQFFRADNAGSLNNIYQTINKLEPVKSDNITVRPVTPLYPWSLGLALILCFILAILKARRN